MRKLVLCAAAFVLSAVAAAGDPWDDWSAGFNAQMSACVQANGAKDTSCLFKAFQSKDRPAATGTFVDDELTRDLRTAEVLLHNTDASNDMYDLYGIDTPDFLGTGYSVPLGPGGAPGSYTQAIQAEYLVPNLCAPGASAVPPCAPVHPRVWTFKFTEAQMTAWADKPIVRMLRSHWPKDDPKGLATAWKASAVPGRPDLPPLVIRFQNFPLAYYNGLVGKNGAQRVFFANFEQVRAKTLRAAMSATGAASLLEKPNPQNTFFVWLYAPDTDSPAAMATWSEVFKLLSAPAP